MASTGGYPDMRVHHPVIYMYVGMVVGVLVLTISLTFLFLLLYLKTPTNSYNKFFRFHHLNEEH